jgi:proline dehydrogenase
MSPADGFTHLQNTHKRQRKSSVQKVETRLAPGGGFARRFIAGESVNEAIDAARALGARGFGVSLDYLGESVSTLELADAATREYLENEREIVASGVERNLTLKLTQLGLDLDRATALDPLRRLLVAAGLSFGDRLRALDMAEG